MAKDQIRYDLLVQEALKGVVRKILVDAGRDGLHGEHHFYISFRTEYPGVRLSNRLREKYPQEMTIVLQHQFWDLQVTDVLFEVGLSFGDVPERLVVPFSAIRGFYDPSVNFELEFDVEVEETVGDNDQGITSIAPVPQSDKPKLATPSAKPKPPVKTAKKPAKGADDKPDTEESDKSTASVVSLDSFRKKK